VFIAAGETIFSNTLLTAIQRNAPKLNAEAIVAAGAFGFRSLVPDADIPGVLQAYNHAITTTYVSTSCSKPRYHIINAGTLVPRPRRDMCRFLHQFWDGLAEATEQKQVNKENPDGV